jgi:hypothetical protein
MTTEDKEAGREARIVLLCGAAALAVTLVYTIAGVIVRPTMFSDSAWGFLGWYGGKGLRFNHVAQVNPDDIATDVLSFVTWWTPGQHVLPGLLERAGLPLGLAIIVVDALFSLIGLAGWYSLYRGFGFPATSSAIALAIIVFARHFALPFGIYNGGEILLFGVAPWFLLLVWRLRRLTWIAIVPLAAGVVAMIFAKLSGLVVSASAIGAAVMAPVGPWLSHERIRRAAIAAITLGVVGAVFYFGWFSRGGTPASSGEPTPWAWKYVVGYAAYAAAGAWSAALSFGDLGAYLFLSPSRPVFATALPVYWLLLPAALITAAFAIWRLREKHAEYLRFALFFWLGTGVVLVAITARGGDLGIEDRHMRLVSLVLWVGLVHAVLGTPSRRLLGVFGAVVLVSSLYGISSATMHVVTNFEHPLGGRGFRHRTADATVLAFIRSIDTSTSDPRSTLIFVTSPEIGLEVRNVRAASNHAEFESLERLRQFRYHGQVPKLYVLVPEPLVHNGKAEVILRSFADYPFDKWQATPIGSFVSYSQIR